MRPLLPLLVLFLLSSLCSGDFTATSTLSNWPASEGEGGEGAAVDTYESGDTLTDTSHVLTSPHLTETSQLPFAVKAHAVKAVDYLGPDLNAASGPYNSTLREAPIQLLSLGKTLCSEILSGTITSRTFINATVLVFEEDLLAICYFSWMYENPASVYWALSDAGCSAIILATQNYVPGLASHLGSALYSDSRSRNHQVHYQDAVPFLAIGRDAGSVLKQRLVSHPDEPVHAFFTMDANRFDIMYLTWLRWLYNVFIGGLSCAALYRAIRVSVAPSLTTKGLVVACELPAVLFLLWMSIRGTTWFTGADPTLGLACGDGLAFLGLVSKILVARFWRTYHAHLKLGADHKFVDPVQASPSLSLCIVGVAFVVQCASGGVRVHFAKTNSGDPDAFIILWAGPFALTYFVATCYFLHAGTSVLRSLTDKRARIISAYVLASSVFMVVHLTAVACVGATVLYQSELAHGLVIFFAYLSRAGTAMCCISIFHAHAGSSFLFMESENARLAKDVRRLTETAVLNAQLAASENALQEAERETEIARLKAERKAEKIELLNQKKLVQKEREINATMQHEVGNPVNVIAGATAYLLDTLKAELSPAIESELRSIKLAADHLQLFTRNSLSSAKMLNGLVELASVFFSPVKLCAEVTEMMRFLLKPGVTLEVVCPNISLALLGAPLQLNQMLLNLVGNACKFTTEGSIVVSATVLEETEETVRIKFAVTDTGLGVPKDKQQIIFELRGQTGDSESQSKGSGIGLSVTSGFAVLMGGTLEVRSPVANNSGSEFSFTLELTKTVEVVKEVVTKELKTPLMNLKALVVDDSKMNQKMMGRKLMGGAFKDLKWDVTYAFTGEKALEMIEGGSVFGVIVMDENLQDAGGVLLGTDATRLIRAREAGGGRRAIIVGHSANQTEADVKKGRESGQDWFWAKPPPTGAQMLQDVTRLFGIVGRTQNGIHIS